MPGVAQPGIVGAREDLSDEILEGDVIDTPYLAWVPKGAPIAGMVQQKQADLTAKVNKRGNADGTPARTPRTMTEDRRLLEYLPHWMKETVSVGKLAMATANVAGIGKAMDLVVEELDKGIEALQIGMEEVLCDAFPQKEQVNGDGGETAGFFNICDTAGGTNADRQIPEKYRIPTASRYSDTLANFSETTMRDLAASAYKTVNKRMSWMGIVGIDLKHKFADFTRYEDGASSDAHIRRYTGSDMEERQICEVVDILKYDGGTFELHLSNHLKTDRAADSNPDTTSTASAASGMFCPMDGSANEVRYAQNPESELLARDGSGERHQIDAIMSHCVFPRKCIVADINS